MRVESKIQEKKIKIFKQGEFVEKSGNIHIPVYKMETKDRSQEDIAERISEIVSSYYLKKCRDNDIDKIFISLYSNLNNTVHNTEENNKLKELGDYILFQTLDFFNNNLGMKVYYYKDDEDGYYESIKIEDSKSGKSCDVEILYYTTAKTMDGRSRNLLFFNDDFFDTLENNDAFDNCISTIIRNLLLGNDTNYEEHPIFMSRNFDGRYKCKKGVEQSDRMATYQDLITIETNEYDLYKSENDIISDKFSMDESESIDSKNIKILKDSLKKLYYEFGSIQNKDNTTIRREKVIGMIQSIEAIIKEKEKSNKKDSYSYFDNWMINLCEEFNNTQSCNQTLNERLQIMSLIKDTIGLIKDEEENPNIYKGLYTNNFYKGLVSSDDKQDTEKPNDSVKINDPNYDNYLRNGCIKIGKIYKTLYYYNGDFSLKRELYMRYYSRLEIESGFDFFNSIKQYLEDVKNIFPTKIFYIGTINGFVISDKPYMDEISHLFLIKTLDRELEFVSIVEYKDFRYEKTCDERTCFTKYGIDTNIPTAVLSFFDEESKDYINDIIKKYF